MWGSNLWPSCYATAASSWFPSSLSQWHFRMTNGGLVAPVCAFISEQRRFVHQFGSQGRALITANENNISSLLKHSVPPTLTLSLTLPVSPPRSTLSSTIHKQILEALKLHKRTKLHKVQHLKSPFYWIRYWSSPDSESWIGCLRS